MVIDTLYIDNIDMDIVSGDLYHTHKIVYIHKTNCPNCGGLLDGDDSIPYTYCKCCGAKVWSEREVS